MSGIIKISCPACGQHIEAPSEAIGESVNCPTCGQGFVPSKPKVDAKKSFGWVSKLIRKIVIYGLIGLIAFGVINYFREQNELRSKFEWGGDCDSLLEGELFDNSHSSVLDKLVAPKTAKFNSTWVRKEDDFGFVKVELDSQNVYGALVRSEWGVVMKHVHYEYQGKKEDFWVARKTIKLVGPKNILK